MMDASSSLRPDYQAGQRASFSKTVTEADVSAFAGLTGDFNPYHVDAEFARRSRFGRRTVHEMLAGGLISAVLSSKLPGQSAGYLSQQMEFLAPVFIGDTVTAVVSVTAWQPEKRIVTLKTECFNQDGVQLMTGQAVLMIHPDGSERGQ